MRLRQILVNLVGNAIKFTAQGEVCIEVRQIPAPNTASDAICLYTRVQDTGIGIPLGSQAHIFDSFAQADGSTTRKHGGTGLGLAIAKQLVEMMGGTIGVDSVSGVGSTFWFTAQLSRQNGFATPAPPSPLGSGTVKHGSPHLAIATPTHSTENTGLLRVLVVDDNPTSRRILEAELTTWSALSESVASGAEALELLCHRTSCGALPQVVMIDLEMPDMDGIALAQAICTLPTLADLRLILLVPVGQDALQEEERLRFFAVLTKPVRRAELSRALEAIFGSAAQGAVDSCGSCEHIMQSVHHGRILLVEDNPVNQEVGLGMLETLGYHVDVVENGRQALDAFWQTRYDLVLMDCQMPEMDGFEATKAIRAKEAAASHTPIIAMTANAMVGDREQCLAAGMDDYLSKPFSLEMLEDMLSQWLSASRYRRRECD